jgi:hypothetical protein
MDDTIILSVSLASGQFHSALKVPLPATSEKVNEAIEKWLKLVQTGLQVNATNMDVILVDKDKKGD